MIQLAECQNSEEARALDRSQRASGGLPYGRGVVGRAFSEYPDGSCQGRGSQDHFGLESIVPGKCPRSECGEPHCCLRSSMPPRWTVSRRFARDTWPTWIELATLSNSADGNRRREAMVQTLTQWREADLKVIAASEADKQGEACSCTATSDTPVPGTRRCLDRLPDLPAAAGRQNQPGATRLRLLRPRCSCWRSVAIWLAISCALGVD